MSSEEFTELMAYEAIEPEPAEVMTGLLAELLALFANVYRAQGEPAYASGDFLPGGDRRGRLSAEMAARLTGQASGMAVMAEFAANHAARKN